jgi:hypothetical protein
VQQKATAGRDKCDAAGWSDHCNGRRRYQSLLTTFPSRNVKKVAVLVTADVVSAILAAA